MSPLRILVVLLCGALSAAAEDSTRKIAFEKDRKIFVANLDGTGAKKIGIGLFPDISHDGTRVAFNIEEQKGTTWARHIVFVEIGSGKMTVFKDVPSDNVYYPKWAPDDKQLVFTLYDGKVWSLVLINADGTGFHMLKKGRDTDTTLYSPCWAADGKSVFAQDMKNVYRLGLDGAEIAHWEIDKIIPNGGMSGDGRVDVSPDGQKLLLGIDMNEEARRKDWDGPLPATWSFDLATKKATRLTTKKLFAWDGCWLDNANVLILSQSAGEKQASIYRLPVEGGAPKLVAKDARQPTVSR